LKFPLPFCLQLDAPFIIFSLSYLVVYGLLSPLPAPLSLITGRNSTISLQHRPPERPRHFLTFNQTGLPSLPRLLPPLFYQTQQDTALQTTLPPDSPLRRGVPVFSPLKMTIYALFFFLPALNKFPRPSIKAATAVIPTPQ